MGSQPIADLSIAITGDFSKLDQDLAQSIIAAEVGGEKIAEAFTTAAGGADQFDTAMEALNEQIKLTGGELLKWDKETATSAQAAVQAAGGIDKMTQSAQAAAQAFDQQQSSVSKLGDAFRAFANTTVEANTNSDGLLSTLLQFGGVVLTMQGLAAAFKDAFNAAARLDDINDSLTFMSGSAKAAAAEIQGLQIIANDTAMALPQVLKADQNLRAMGVSAKDAASLLRAAADASSITGKGFETTANALERMVEGGMASNRQLLQLGITTRDLGAVLGVTSGEVAKLFKGLDESARVDVVLAALAKFKNAAHDTSQDVFGEWQRLRNLAETEFAAMGTAMAPAIQGLITFAADTVRESASIIKNLSSIGSAFDMLSGQVVASFAAIAIALRGNPMAALGVELVQLGLAWRGYADAEKEAADASKQSDAAFSRLIISERQLLADFPEFSSRFNALVKDMQSGVLSWDQFQLKVRDLNTEFHNLHPTIDTTQVKTKSLTQDIADLKAKFDDGKISQAQYAADLKKIIAAHSEVADSTKALAEQQKQFWKDLEAAYKHWDDGLKDSISSIGTTLQIASNLATNGSTAIIGTFKEQGAAFAEWTKQSAALADKLGPPFEVFARDVKDVYPEITKLATELGHFPTLSEQVAAGLTRIVGNLDKIKTEGGGALDALLESGKSTVQIVTDLNQVVSETGTVLSSMGQAGVSAFQSMDAAIKQANADFKDWAAGVGSFSSQLGILDQQAGGKGRRGGPGTTNAQGDFNTGVSLPPHTHLDYSFWGISGAKVVPDNGYYFDINGNVIEADWHILANGGTIPGMESPSASTPGVAAPVAAAPVATAPALPPQVQYLLSQGFTLDQMVTGIDTLNTTLDQSADKISAAVTTLAPVIDAAASAITQSSDAQTAAYSRMAEALTPAAVPQVNAGTPAAFQQLGPANRTLAVTGASGTPQTVNINAAPQLGTLMNQIMEELQRMGIRF